MVAMRNGKDRLKIVCSKCGTTICYWVADRPPLPMEPARACDVTLTDGTPVARGAPTPGCQKCGVKSLPFSRYSAVPGIAGTFITTIENEAYMVRTNEHADE
jgi:hypothetical protein